MGLLRIPTQGAIGLHDLINQELGSSQHIQLENIPFCGAEKIQANDPEAYRAEIAVDVERVGPIIRATPYPVG